MFLLSFLPIQQSLREKLVELQGLNLQEKRLMRGEKYAQLSDHSTSFLTAINISLKHVPSMMRIDV